MEKKIEAVCFDYRGTVLDHNSDRELVAGMEEILSGLVERNIRLLRLGPYSEAHAFRPDSIRLNCRIGLL